MRTDNVKNEANTDIYYEKRLSLAKIAEYEAKQGYKGNENKCGTEIEKYLSPFRETFNKYGKDGIDYGDLNIGWDWCCVFVYWCCREAGFDFPVRPMDRCTLAAVPNWYNWANTEGNSFYIPMDSESFEPRVGDIVIFNGVFDGKDMDHIGIIIEVYEGYIVTAEGNLDNATGIIKRALDGHINGLVRLDSF